MAAGTSRLLIEAEVALPYGLRAWLQRTGGALQTAVFPRGRTELTLTLCDDERIQRLNREHLGIDAPTDVLSFGLLTDRVAFPLGSRAREPLGDLVVALPTAERQATEHSHSLRSELVHLLVHGMLHIAGHDHGEAVAAAGMEHAEAAAVRQAMETLTARDRLGILVPHG